MDSNQGIDQEERAVVFDVLSDVGRYSLTAYPVGNNVNEVRKLLQTGEHIIAFSEDGSLDDVGVSGIVHK